jgi:long-chain-alcohol oxidase
MKGTEGEGFDRYYENGGILATMDTGISVLAGSAFGGGSAINWACCLETPW